MTSALPPTPAFVLFALKKEISVKSTRVVDALPSEQDKIWQRPFLRSRDAKPAQKPHSELRVLAKIARFRQKINLTTIQPRIEADQRREASNAARLPLRELGTPAG
jgi:hypothetical protein